MLNKYFKKIFFDDQKFRKKNNLQNKTNLFLKFVAVIFGLNFFCKPA